MTLPHHPLVLTVPAVTSWIEGLSLTPVEIWGHKTGSKTGRDWRLKALKEGALAVVSLWLFIFCLDLDPGRRLGQSREVGWKLVRSDGLHPHPPLAQIPRKYMGSSKVEE